jgi:hypothetical protein
MWVTSKWKREKICDGDIGSGCVYIGRFEALERSLIDISEKLSQMQQDIRNLTGR